VPCPSASPKPPLVEAVFEVFVDPSAWGGERSYDEVEQRVRLRLTGKRDQLVPFALQVQLAPGKVPELSHLAEPPRRRIWSEDGAEMFQFGPNMCAYNVLKHYEQFETHAPAMEELFGMYLGVVRPPALLWAGQRYINKVAVPAAEGAPGEWFQFYPRLPAGTHGPFGLQVMADEFPGGRTVLSLAFQGVHDGRAEYVLDIYSRSTEPPALDPKALRSWHEAAHNSVRAVFRAALTDRTRKMFEEEPR